MVTLLSKQKNTYFQKKLVFWRILPGREIKFGHNDLKQCMYLRAQSYNY